METNDMANSTHKIRVFTNRGWSPELTVKLSGVVYLRVLGHFTDDRWFVQPDGGPVTDEKLIGVLNSIAGLEEVTA